MGCTQFLTASQFHPQKYSGAGDESGFRVKALNPSFRSWPAGHDSPVHPPQCDHMLHPLASCATDALCRCLHAHARTLQSSARHAQLQHWLTLRQGQKERDKRERGKKRERERSRRDPLQVDAAMPRPGSCATNHAHECPRSPRPALEAVALCGTPDEGRFGRNNKNRSQLWSLSTTQLASQLSRDLELAVHLRLLTVITTPSLMEKDPKQLLVLLPCCCRPHACMPTSQLVCQSVSPLPLPPLPALLSFLPSFLAAPQSAIFWQSYHAMPMRALTSSRLFLPTTKSLHTKLSELRRLALYCLLNN